MEETTASKICGGGVLGAHVRREGHCQKRQGACATLINMFHQVGKLWARRQVTRLAQRRGLGVARRCPSCGAGLPTALPVCPACRYVGKVEDSVTHHELLGLPYGPNPFVVDTGELKRRFHEAQRLCHPDGWATRSEVR